MKVRVQVPSGLKRLSACAGRVGLMVGSTAAAGRGTSAQIEIICSSSNL
jgi:hypothetical protein